MQENLNRSLENKNLVVPPGLAEKGTKPAADNAVLLDLESKRNQLLLRYQPIKVKLEAKVQLNPEEEAEMADIADKMHKVAGAIADFHARTDTTVH